MARNRNALAHRSRGGNYLEAQPLDKLFEDFYSRMDNIFHSYLPSKHFFSTVKGASFPKINGYLDNQSGDVYLEASIPGRNRENVEVSLEKGYLTILGESINENVEEEDDGKTYFSRELMKGKFSRTIGPFSQEVYDLENVKAKVEDGMLRIHIPRLQNIKEEDKKSVLEIE